MKSKKLFYMFNILILYCLISALTTFNADALKDENQKNYNISTIDRSSWAWTGPQIISSESDMGSFKPQIVNDEEGNLYCVWDDNSGILGSGNDWDILFKRWDADTFEWSLTEVISTESVNDSTNPFITIDSIGNIYCVWEDDSDYLGAEEDDDIFFKFWNSTISSWTTTEVVSTESTANSQNPVLGFDKYGIFYIAWHDNTPILSSNTDADIFLKRWTSLNGTFGPTELVSTESNGFSFKPYIIVDPEGHFFLTWQDNTNYLSAGTDYDIFFKAWNYTGYTWSSAIVISTQSTLDAWTPTMVQDSNYDIHFAWSDTTDYYGTAGSDRDICYRKMIYETSFLTSTEVISVVSTDISEAPSLTIDSENNLYLAWSDPTDYDSAGTDVDIFYCYKDATYGLWSTIEVISSESTIHSQQPILLLDPSGVIQLVWSDGTNLYSSGSDYDIFYKYFSGPPEEPELAYIVPNPTDSNSIILDWSNVSWSFEYFVYRSDSYIWTVEDLTPIATLTTSYYVDTLSAEGYFYYVIVAGNAAGNSSRSNCEYVEYRLSHVGEYTIVTSILLATLITSIVFFRIKKRKLD